MDRGGGPADRQKHFVIDGEVVVLGVDGVSDFDAFDSRKHDDEVQLYVFDMLAGDGEDLRKLPLSKTKTNLSRLLARRVEEFTWRRSSRAVSARTVPPRLPDRVGRHGLEHRESSYRGGRFRHWIKIKNREHPAYSRVQDQF